MKLISYTPYRLAEKQTALDPVPVRTALTWATFAYLLRKDKAFSNRVARQILDSLEDYATVQAHVLQTLHQTLPWLKDLTDSISADPVEHAFEAYAEKLDLMEGTVRFSGRQRFTEAAFQLDWQGLAPEQQHWMKLALVSWPEALVSLETRVLNKTFPTYADFAIDLKQQLKHPGFTALYVEPDAAEEELWIAFSRIPDVRRHLEKHHGKGRQIRTVWALPKRREIANWLVLD